MISKHFFDSFIFKFSWNLLSVSYFGTETNKVNGQGKASYFMKTDLILDNHLIYCYLLWEMGDGAVDRTVRRSLKIYHFPFLESFLSVNAEIR